MTLCDDKDETESTTTSCNSSIIREALAEDFNLLEDIVEEDCNPKPCIIHCPGGGLPARARGKPVYPFNKTGFPFSGNTNNPGSALSSKIRCANKIVNTRKGSLRTIYYPSTPNINTTCYNVFTSKNLGKTNLNKF